MRIKQVFYMAMLAFTTSVVAVSAVAEDTPAPGDAVPYAEPTYHDCFAASQAAMQAEQDKINAEAEALSHGDASLPATIQNDNENSAVGDKLQQGVKLTIDPANQTATPQVEIDHYPVEMSDDASPTKAVTKEDWIRRMCKIKYGISF